MDFYELRKKYDSIIYKSFKSVEDEKEIQISYLYKLGELT